MEFIVYKDCNKWLISSSAMGYKPYLDQISFNERSHADIVVMLLKESYNRGKEELQASIKELLNIEAE